MLVQLCDYVNYMYICMGWYDVMRCGMNVCAYVLRQFELSDTCKAVMISLTRGFCRVRV